MASCAHMYEFRALRESMGLGQRDLAEFLGVRLETLRTWD
jgi:DNA-binding transcriptional regulator YiaG